jgi:hypothetical protein
MICFLIICLRKISAAASDLLTNCPKITFNLFSDESFSVPRRVTKQRVGQWFGSGSSESAVRWRRG